MSFPQWQANSGDGSNGGGSDFEIDLVTSDEEDGVPLAARAKSAKLSAPSAKAPAKKAARGKKADRPQVVFTPHSPK